MERLQLLIDALREELQNYGEMLALLDQQQELVVGRVANDILDSVTSINAQSLLIQSVRQTRAACQREMALQLQLPPDSAFSAIIPALPQSYGLLAQALVDENNELLLRVQSRARQNHLLLSRSLDLMQRFIATLFPASRSPVYGETGQLYDRILAERSLYEAIG